MADAGVDRLLQELQHQGASLWTSLSRLPSHVLSADCRARLLKAVQAERNFVDRLTAQDRSAIADAHLSSSNFGHLEGVLFVLEKQSWHVTGATAALKSFHRSSPRVSSEDDGRKEEAVDGKELVVVHVDLVCHLLGESVWVVVINSSPQNRLWIDTKKTNKGLHSRVSSLLQFASSGSAARPSAIVLVVRDGFDSEIEQKLQEQFQTSKLSQIDVEGGEEEEEDLVSSSSCDFQEVEDGDWVNVHLSTNKVKRWRCYRIRITPATHLCSKHCTASVALADDAFEEESEDEASVTGTSPCWEVIKSLGARHGEFDELQREWKILNLDTTALVAIVSELTNGGTAHILKMSGEEREARFPGMAKFVYEQALLERIEPFLPQFEQMLSDKLPVICEYVYGEFKSIVLAHGGPREKQRAQILLTRLKVVPNLPSARVEALPDTGKIKRRHKLVFGSGDFLRAPTVTANLSFVRAVQQQGVPLAIIQHQPCALLGSK